MGRFLQTTKKNIYFKGFNVSSNLKKGKFRARHFIL